MSEIALAAGIVELLIRLESAYEQAKQARDEAARQAAMAKMEALFEEIKDRRASLTTSLSMSSATFVKP